MPLKTDGIESVRGWWVFAGVFVIAAIANLIRNSDVDPPLRFARILRRALLAGIVTMGLSFIIVDRWTVSWMLLLGGAGFVGYWGAEIIVWVGAGMKVAIMNYASRAGGGKQDEP